MPEIEVNDSFIAGVKSAQNMYKAIIDMDLNGIDDDLMMYVIASSPDFTIHTIEVVKTDLKRMMADGDVIIRDGVLKFSI